MEVVDVKTAKPTGKNFRVNVIDLLAHKPGQVLIIVENASYYFFKVIS